ncbi:copper homeostasis membrane protein CopD [uncultured Phenylobacterium sp.]|uniref:copper homeostasis membrane protein CopD n=1 Tax=uncultured Phenylobacterium sp. TaxID=349273 RepID=UPI0025E26363|nr:copper homeostasis membrane protein CopD [uncultured Phenylobacterium sp.]
MIEAALVFVRLAQYVGAAILLGSPLFFLYSLPRQGNMTAASLGWPRRLLVGGALLTLLGAALGLVVQTATMAGSIEEALKPASLAFMVSGTTIGRAAVARAVFGALALVLLLAMKPGRALWTGVALFGALAAASLAWMGHGGATEGPGAAFHLAGDILHSLAASVWIGALVVFLILLLARGASPERTRALYAALHGFSGLGTLLVAVLLASGLVNSWFLVGPDRISGLWTTGYGRLLVLKLLLFAAMLALAAANRFRLTPALHAAIEAGESRDHALRRLRSSLVLETTAGVAILGLVAWLGTLAPVAAQ